MKPPEEHLFIWIKILGMKSSDIIPLAYQISKFYKHSDAHPLPDIVLIR